MSGEKEPTHVVRDLMKKAADDALDVCKRTAYLCDHPQDRLVILLGAMASCLGAAVFEMYRITGQQPPDRVPPEDMRRLGIILVKRCSKIIQQDR